MKIVAYLSPTAGSDFARTNNFSEPSTMLSGMPFCAKYVPVEVLIGVPFHVFFLVSFLSLIWVNPIMCSHAFLCVKYSHVGLPFAVEFMYTF